MARPRKWTSEAERVAAYRASKAVDVDPELPERDVNEPEPAPGARTVDALLVLPAGASLSDVEEQLLRDHFGYTSSERRTRAEREAAAAKMLAGLPAPGPEVLAAIETLKAEERRLAERQKAYIESLKTRVPAP